jgi:three-Cys-motif partner protein
MAIGTSGGLLGDLDGNAQSLFKHELLSHYLETFTSMTGKNAPGRRVVVLDGFAGRGRYPDGRPASAERILRAMLNQKKFRDIDAFFVEKSPADYVVLAGVVAEYIAQGVDGVALRGKVEDHLEQVVEQATGVPLFLFLDPCGAGVEFDRLAGLLAGPRTRGGPVTEVLLNFSADLSRRVAGVLRSQAPKEQRAMDAACGGSWWRPVAQEALDNAPTDPSGKPSFEPVAQAIAEQYARLLAETADMFPVTVPVYRQLGHQPVYHLVFFTRSEYGLWVFAHAAALARQAWLRHLGRLADERDGLTLISDLALKEELIRREESTARAIIAGNLRDLLARVSRFRLVDQTLQVFGAAYGVATEDTVRQVVLDLQAAGELWVGQSNRRPSQRARTRELVVLRPRSAP